LPRNVEEVLDDGSHRDRRENEVQQRYPNHVDPYVIIVGIANLSVHMKCEPNVSTVCKIIDLGEIPEVAVGTGWDLPGYRVLDSIVYGEEFDPREHIFQIIIPVRLEPIMVIRSKFLQANVVLGQDFVSVVLRIVKHIRYVEISCGDLERPPIVFKERVILKDDRVLYLVIKVVVSVHRAPDKLLKVVSREEVHLVSDILVIIGVLDSFKKGANLQHHHYRSSPRGISRRRG
jgi:hypothetical protein